MSVYLGTALKALGYEPCDPLTQQGDFVLQDDSNGEGPYIKIWREDLPQPDPATLAAKIAEIEAENAG